MATLKLGSTTAISESSGVISYPTGTLSNTVGMPIRHITHFEDATRNVAISASTSSVAIATTINKKFDGSTTNILAIGRTPVSSQASYHAGCYMEIGGTKKYETAHFASPPNSTGDDSQYGTIFWNGIFTGLATGNLTVNLGWSTRNSSAQNPGGHWNPSERSARAQARTTIIDFFEVDVSSSFYTSIT